MITELTTDSPQWKNFLESHDHLIIHRPEWKEFIEKTFLKIKVGYLSIQEEDKIKSILPFFFQPSNLILNWMLGKNSQEKAISSSFYEYGGLAGKKISGEEWKEIFLELRKKFPLAKFLEIREGLDNSYPDYAVKRIFLKRFVLPLSSEKEVWQNIQKSKRKAIKKSLKEVTVKEVPFTMLKELYSLYINNMKRFGSLPYPKRYFINFYKCIVNKNLGKVMGAFYKEKLIAVLTGVTVSKRIHILINVSDKSFLSLRPNDAVHWYFIKWGCDKGYSYFDFGRTAEDRGHFEYKGKWGGELKDLSYYYFPLKESVPNFDQKNNPRCYSFTIKFMPNIILEKIGSWFRQFLY
ncbi:MAG: GNAT family N-acetyltransferase [Nanoarchaeota archaeon]